VGPANDEKGALDFCAGVRVGRMPSGVNSLGILSLEVCMSVSQIIQKLRKELPVCFVRKEVPRLLGGIIAVGTLANLDSQKLGPPFHRVRGKVLYERDTFLDWLSIYIEKSV